MVTPSTNQLAERLERDEPVYGINALTASPAVIEALAGSGIDYVWVDLEHAGPSPYDSGSVAELARAAEAADLELLVRVPDADPHMVNKVVDAGVRTVIVPRVESAAEVRRAVAASRFEYDGDTGDRGAPLARSTGWLPADASFAETADSDVLVGVMIETAGALDALDEVLSVSELGFAFVGPGDLSIGLGHPLQSDHPSVDDAIAQIETTADRHDVPLGRIATASEAIEAAVEAGYRVLRIGVDTVAVAETVAQRVDAVSDR